jgi:hypothetical protein
MSIASIVDTMAAALDLKLPELETCEQVGGRITLEELQDRSRKLPAGFVACMGTRDGEIVANKFKTRGLFLLVLAVQSRKEDGVLPQDKVRAVGRLLSKALYKIAFAKDWGSDEVESRPQKITSLNPYTQAANKNNVALWGITWEQDLSLSDPGETVLDDFLVAEVDYQAAGHPEIDAHDTLILNPP